MQKQFFWSKILSKECKNLFSIICRRFLTINTQITLTYGNGLKKGGGAGDNLKGSIRVYSLCEIFVLDLNQSRFTGGLYILRNRLSVTIVMKRNLILQTEKSKHKKICQHHHVLLNLEINGKLIL